MRYGHFDDDNREYVIERPDTPSSWSNYLGSTEYCAIITNNAGGFSFYKSTFHGRFLRLHFNAAPLDQPGRYFYIRDDKTGDYWSASWQPVGKPLDQYKSVCRHGIHYTVIESQYSGIKTEATYFVPLNQDFEYWILKLSNHSKNTRDLSVFTYAEFTSHWNLHQDLHNLQYSQNLIKADWVEDYLQLSACGGFRETGSELPEDVHRSFSWMTYAGMDLESFDTLRGKFIGSPHRGYHNPLAVENGVCSNSLAYGDTGCGSLHFKAQLKPGEEKTLLILMGVKKPVEALRKNINHYKNQDAAFRELDRLKKHWHGIIGNFTAKTPDDDFNHMINVWNAYNNLVAFNWSRSASLIYNGERNGLGFRDTVQDIIGVLPLIPESAEKQLRLMLTGQLANGGAMLVIDPFSHNPGHETPPAPEKLRSDDCLWFFNTVPAYVAETGNTDFYREVLPYADHGEGTVFDHLKQALLFNLERTGTNGLPAGLQSDWNDCFNMGDKGESLFVTFQVRFGLLEYKKIAILLNKPQEAEWATSQLIELDSKIKKFAWDGSWFIRAINRDGKIWGSSRTKEGSIFLNAQSWAVISGAASEEQAGKAMDSVEEHLYTDYGLMICAPPFRTVPIDEISAVQFNPGVKENGGIFCHPQGWAVMAECMLGNGERAYRYYRNYMPSAYNDRAEIRESEPYVHAQATHSIFSRGFGKTRLSWLTGTAPWAYYAAINYILGIRPDVNGLIIDPCIPSGWDGFTVRKKFRGKWVNITVSNPGKKNKGVKELKVNGKSISGNMIPAEMIAGTADNIEVTAVMG